MHALLRTVSFTWLFAAVLLLVAGCDRQIAPPLVEVTEITPREIEPGERLELHGTGFPQGHTGLVTLEGAVSRPGEPPAQAVVVEAEGTVSTPDRLEVVVRETFAERLCGYGDRAAHATFRGNVQVAFASSIPGAPPLVGVLRGVVLDVMPSTARASVLDARAAEGGRVLSFLGIVSAAPTPRGIPVEQVRAGSLADRAGIQVGDVLVSADGVHALALADVAPASARELELTVRRADSGIEEVKTLALLDYSGERVPTEYAPAFVIVGLALAILLLLVLPGPPSLATLELRIASRMRRSSLRALLAALLGEGRHAALSAMVSAVIAAFALTPWIVGREVDGVVLLAIGAAMLVWSRVALARGVLASLATLLQSMLAVLAIAGAFALLVGQVGAIELAEIVRLQGGAPWQFAAARYPSCAIVAAVVAAAVTAVLRVRSDSSAPAYAALLERAGVLFLSALFVAAFLGGWQLPGTTDARGHGLVLAAAGVFVLKTWLVAGLFVGASQVTARMRSSDLPRFLLKRLLPGLVLGAATVVASRRLLPSIAVETAFGATLVALAVLFAIRLAARVRAALARPEPHASPFI